MKKASPAQHGMWLTQRMGIARTAYDMPLPIELVGPLDLAALDRAWEVVLARHPILTSSFEEVDGELFVRPGGGAHFRYGIEQTGPDRHRLRIDADHLVFDGESKDILVRHLATAYAGEELPPPATSVDTADEAAARAYWAAQWREPQEPELPGMSSHSRTARPGACLDFELEGFAVEGFSRFEVLFAALHGLLIRYGNEDPTIAVDMSTRTDPEEIGLLVNELPVRPDRPGLAAVKAKLREIYPHRAVPLSRVVGLAPRPAIAPVSLSYRRRRGDVAWPGLTANVEWMAFHGTARNALHVQMVDDGRVVKVRLQYDPACGLDAEQVARDYRAVLRGSELPPSLVHGPVRAVNGRLDKLVDRQIEATPERIAVTGALGSLTYGQLGAQAQGFADRLRALGIGPGDRVAVRMRRSPALLAGLLGVLRTGASFVPIDPAYPEARQALLLLDAEPAALVTDEDVIRLADAQSDVDGLAYVIYTSGSSGRPKGVEVEHRSVVNLLQAMGDTIGAGRWLAVASFAFDMSVPELWLPLTNGETVVMATEEQARDGEKLLKLIRGAGVTHVHVPPTTWDRLLEAGFDEPGIVAISGAEALPAPLARRIESRSARLWNLYGPTETTVWSTASHVDAGVVTLGRPLANTQVHVLDAQLRPVPPGIAGELCIGGAGVARGYHNRPDLTHERFVHTGWGRLYRTGDRVRLLRSGELEWLGRFDDQIKLRGYRIELGEIEAALLEHPRVRAAAVTANPELAAYVVGPVEGLREHLSQLLPAYMVPTAYITLPALPLTPNGKLDRSALPAPAFEVSTVELTGRAREVFDVWAEVLGRNDFGPDESLFDLGGHSLTVTKIASRLRRRGYQVPLHVFFDHPTVSGVAAALEEQR
jgi:non-ribosomal peptide synthetase component F